MAKRPLLEKKVRRLRKALRNTPPTYIDLVQYLTDRRLAKSKKHARELMVAGKVMVDSHKVGRIQVPDLINGDENDMRWIPQPLLSSQHRGNIVVLDS